MVCLYVTSIEEGAGRTMLCAGLGKHLRDNGKKLGYFKPVIGEQPSGATGDHDALFMKQVLGLAEDADIISPVFADKEKLAGGIREAYARVASGKDVVITEALFQPALMAELDARVVAVESYQVAGMKTADTYLELGEQLLGLVLNKVPVNKLGLIRDDTLAGGDILAVLPEDRVLYALSIGELAERLQGEILNSAEQSGEIVANIMIGAMVVDPGPEYFGRKSQKAVVVRGDRPDMQLAALETPTGCLILCGNTPPIHTVLYEAEKRKVPVILVPGDIKNTVASIEDVLERSRFNQPKKLTRLTELMGKNFGFGALYQGLGLSQA
ncbi:DRTGG domain-containing protein [Chloroflexota bacterium]